MPDPGSPPSQPSFDAEADGLIREQFEAIFNASYDGIWVCDGKGIILRLNRAAEELNGVRAQDVVGHHLRFLEERGIVDSAVSLKVIAQKRPVTIMQFAPITGKKLLVTANPIFDSQGRVALVVTNERDITELDNLRHALLQNNSSPTPPWPEMLSPDLEKIRSSKVIGRSEPMRRVLYTALHVARFKTTVLITGQSGTGKGLLARTIHACSERAGGPFVRVDCGAIPASLFESEVFGYDQGAFTGAKKSGKKGLFEQAEGGTLFLDEIGLVPYDVQHKLLRFLESGELLRVGGTHPIRLDVRLIAATNEDLTAAVKESRLRPDLYYRLSVIPIEMPPLKDRLEDIPLLVNHFLKRFGKLYQAERTISAPAVEALMAYEWPGNVRELENLIERLVVMSRGPTIELVDLPSTFRRHEQVLSTPELPEGRDLKSLVREFETCLIEQALKRYGTQEAAARALGISQSSVARKLRR